MLFDDMANYDPAKYRDLAISEAKVVVQLVSIIADAEFRLLDPFLVSSFLLSRW